MIVNNEKGTEIVLQRSAGGSLILQWVLWILLPFHFSLFTFNACNETFEPFQEDRHAFSIYGFLDAAADTHWVRVMPLRQQVDMSSEKPEMHVTLEHLESGSKVVMNDSMIQLQQNVNALNVWTDINIKPDQTYRLHATRMDGTSSHVNVTLPEDFPTPRLQMMQDGVNARLFISGVNRLADVQTRLIVRIIAPDSGWDYERIFWVSYRSQAYEESPGEYTLIIRPGRDLAIVSDQIPLPPRGELELEVIHRQVYVASGGPEWNDEILSLDNLVYALPDVVSNVENGVGYFVGVVGKAIPYESCYDENNELELIACDVEKPIL